MGQFKSAIDNEIYIAEKYASKNKFQFKPRIQKVQFEFLMKKGVGFL